MSIIAACTTNPRLKSRVPCRVTCKKLRMRRQARLSPRVPFETVQKFLVHGSKIFAPHRVERRRAMGRPIGFRCIRPFGLRGKEPPDPAYVSSSPSKIPYNGFSPVRLQTGIQPLRPSTARRTLKRHTRIHARHPALYAAARPPLCPCGPCGQDVGACSQDVPVQRPLARRRVLSSRQVVAYYGLICASRSHSPLYGLWQRVHARRSAPGWVREDPQFTLPVYSLRAIFRTPAD